MACPGSSTIKHVITISVLLLLSQNTAAQTPELGSELSFPLGWETEAIAVGGMWGGAGGMFLMGIDRNIPNWDIAPGLDLSIRSALMASTPSGLEDARIFGDIVEIGGTIVMGVGLPFMANMLYGKNPWQGFGGDFLAITEGVALGSFFTQITKFFALRERPNEGNNLSFWSGHTQFAFGVVSTYTAVAEMRNYPYSAGVSIVGYMGASFVGLMAIMSDRHWFTDVVVGATVGTLIGYFLPKLLHNPDLDLPFEITPVIGEESSLALSFKF